MSLVDRLAAAYATIGFIIAIVAWACVELTLFEFTILIALWPIVAFLGIVAVAL